MIADSRKKRIRVWRETRREPLPQSAGESADTVEWTEGDAGGDAEPPAFSSRTLVATIMLNYISRNEKLSEESRASTLLERGRLKQAMDESIRRLRKSPESLFAIETLLKAQWRTGDILGALKWVRRALRINPNEPGYYFTRGLLRQSLGMYPEAMQDFECAKNVARTEEMKEQASAALIALEEWQVEMVNILLVEDRAFRHAFRVDPVAATAERGFRFTPDGNKTLALIAVTQSATDDNVRSFAGIC
jgi:tetratricopeptide (TPR) repeat protein